MPETVEKHKPWWSAYLVGVGFVGAAAIRLWMLLQRWASLIAR